MALVVSSRFYFTLYVAFYLTLVLGSLFFNYFTFFTAFCFTLVLHNVIRVAVGSCEEQQVPDGAEETAGSSREEGHESQPRQPGK